MCETVNHFIVSVQKIKIPMPIKICLNISLRLFEQDYLLLFKHKVDHSSQSSSIIGLPLGGTTSRLPTKL